MEDKNIVAILMIIFVLIGFGSLVYTEYVHYYKEKNLCENNNLLYDSTHTICYEINNGVVNTKEIIWLGGNPYIK